METEKSCSNCNYGIIMYNQFPCDRCSFINNSIGLLNYYKKYEVNHDTI